MAIRKLPKWCITDKFPTFYDTESATAIEQTAKLYGAVNEIIEDYNKFVDDTNKVIEDFEAGIIKDVDEFKVAMSQQFQDFIDVVELKIANQDKNIEDTLNQMKNEFMDYVTNINDEILVNIDNKINDEVSARTQGDLAVKEELTTLLNDHNHNEEYANINHNHSDYLLRSEASVQYNNTKDKLDDIEVRLMDIENGSSSGSGQTIELLEVDLYCEAGGGDRRGQFSSEHTAEYTLDTEYHDYTIMSILKIGLLETDLVINRYEIDNTNHKIKLYIVEHQTDLNGTFYYPDIKVLLMKVNRNE